MLVHKMVGDWVQNGFVRTDIDHPVCPVEDLQLHGVGSLQGRHFVAVSKHLCGPATGIDPSF